MFELHESPDVILCTLTVTEEKVLPCSNEEVKRGDVFNLELLQTILDF